MKFRFSALFGLVASLLGTLTAPASAVPDVVILFTASPQKIHWLPNANSSVEATTRQNDVVIVSLNLCEKGFCRVWHPYSRQMGHIRIVPALVQQPAPLTIPGRPTEGFATATRDFYIFEAPFDKSRKLGNLVPGMRVKKEICIANYCYLTTEFGYQGWGTKFGLKDDRVINGPKVSRGSDFTAPFSGTTKPIQAPRKINPGR